MQNNDQEQVLSAENGFLNMEPGASLDGIYASGQLPEVLRHTLDGAFSWQRRNETTLERSLNMPGLAPQWVGGLLAGGALVRINGKELPLSEMLQLPAKQEIELVYLPLQGLYWGIAQVARTPVDDPIVFAIAAIEMRGDIVLNARVALTGVWSTSVGLAKSASALAGGTLSVGKISEVSEKVTSEVSPKENYLGSVEYRRAMAGVLTRQALTMCMDGMKSYEC